jgi:hypothetical protein
MRSPLLGIVGGFIFSNKKGHLLRNVLNMQLALIFYTSNGFPKGLIRSFFF